MRLRAAGCCETRVCGLRMTSEVVWRPGKRSWADVVTGGEQQPYLARSLKAWGCVSGRRLGGEGGGVRAWDGEMRMACMADVVGSGMQCGRRACARCGGRTWERKAREGETLPELGLVRTRLGVCRRSGGWEMPLFWDNGGVVWWWWWRRGCGGCRDETRPGMGGCEGGLAVGDRDVSTAWRCWVWR